MENKSSRIVEINEEELRTKISDLKEWIKEQTLVPELPDKTLELFLHSCMYDIQDAKATLECYYKLRIKSPEYFSNRNPNDQNLIMASKIGYTLLLPGTTNEGYRVIMVGYFHSDTTNHVFNDLMKRFMMTIDMWLSKLELCPGYIILVESKYSAFGHFTSASFDSLRKICTYFQEALPVRLQNVVFINISPAINMLLTVVHPLLSKKLHNLIRKYPRGNNDYWNMIPQRMLPTEFGGETQSLQEIHEATQKELINYHQWFQKEDELIKNLVEKQPKSENKKMFENLF